MSIFKKLFKTRNKIGGVLSGIFKSSKISSEDYEKIRLLNLNNINIIILKMNFLINKKNDLISFIKNKILNDN